MLLIRACAILTVCIPAATAADSALTIYNQNFAVVREHIPITWTAGISEVRFVGATAHVEPDSMILRAIGGSQNFQILEQNYRNDPISEALLLSLVEGQTIDFVVRNAATPTTIRGKIIRSGYVPHYGAMNQYGSQYAAQQYAQQAATQPLIEVDGKLSFGLPGSPVFPSLGTNTILKPTLLWRVRAPSAGKGDAELSYVSGGMNWKADYNIVGNEKDSKIDVIGWVTMDNQTGKTFENAHIQLMAGDVNKRPPESFERFDGARLASGSGGAYIAAPPITERRFDEYHLYSLDNQTTLLDRETKQVEFVRANDAKSTPVYVYEGAVIDANRYRGWNWENIRNDQNYGIESNPKVWVMREFQNTKENHLGIALPKGRVRFYTRDDAGRLQFVGENNIDHTPSGELVRVYTGNAFDLVGERKRTSYQNDIQNRSASESFEIKLRNRKTTATEIRVVERLYRGDNWNLTAQSDRFNKMDSNTIEFRIPVQPNEERVVTYTVHYTW
jgi:hypothetical protein